MRLTHLNLCHNTTAGRSLFYATGSHTFTAANSDRLQKQYNSLLGFPSHNHDPPSKKKMSSTPMSTIEKMPAEIQHIILLSMPDIASLAGLVHASPSYHAAYASRRITILSTITVRELQLRGLYLFTAGCHLEAWITHGEHEKAEWSRLLEHCFDQAPTGGIVPRLSIEESILLLGVKAAELWWMVDDGHAKGPFLNGKIVDSSEVRETALPDRSVLDRDYFHFTVTWAPPYSTSYNSTRKDKREFRQVWSRPSQDAREME